MQVKMPIRPDTPRRPATMTPPTDAATPSPCVGVCVLTPSQRCLGCGRTPEEIGEWTTADEPRRMAIAAAARQRMATDRSSG